MARFKRRGSVGRRGGSRGRRRGRRFGGRKQMLRPLRVGFRM